MMPSSVFPNCVQELIENHPGLTPAQLGAILTLFEERVRNSHSPNR